LEVKIAHIAPRLSFGGGTEKFVIEVDKAMRGLGAQSRIYSASTSLRPDYLGDIAVSVPLGRRAVKDGCDALFFHQGQEAAMFFHNRHTLAYFHEAKYDLVTGPSGRAYTIFLREPARHCPQIICNSHYTASRIGAVLERDNIPVVYPGVSIDPEEQDGVSRPELFCYYHSRFHPRKNHNLLLEIFSGLPYQLHMTGGTWDQKFENYQQKVFQRASEMSNLHVRGNIDETRRKLLLAQAALFLFPARDEPFGLALLEAMASGKPIVALNSGATAEVLGDAGVLCDSSVDEWRRSIESLLSDHELRVSLGRKSIERAKLFPWTRTAREMIRLVEGWN
jgi:glycosyltransferase involved in cell wall biosynthesis